MKKLKAVQIGTGHDHYFAPANSLKKRNDVDFAGFVRVENDVKTLGGVPELSLSDVLKADDIDAVFIETEDKYLTEYAYEFVSRGIPVHMDKPGGQDKAEFDALFDLARDKKVPLHLGYMYRYNPAVKMAIELVKSGELGKILYVEAQMDCLHGEEKRRWLKDYKGGMMNFLGCHLIDLLLLIQGVPDEVTPYNSASGDGVGEDIGFAVFRYGNNASFVKATAVEAGGFNRRQIVVCGEKGTFEIRPTEYYFAGGGDMIKTDACLSLISERDGLPVSRTEKTTFGPFDRYDEMYGEFFGIVRGETANPYTYEYEKLLHDTVLRACGITVRGAV